MRPTIVQAAVQVHSTSGSVETNDAIVGLFTGSQELSAGGSPAIGT